MDTSKIKVGMRIKSYKAFCETIGEKVRGGTSKEAHIKEIERHVKYRKEGFAFIIEEVYSTPKPKVDARKSPTKRGNNSKYSNDIQALVTNSLARTTGGAINYPISQIITSFSIASLNYGACRNDLDKFAEVSKIPIEYANNFYMLYQAQVRAKVESALNSLRNRALVVWSRDISICILVAKEEYNELNAIKIEVLGDSSNQAVLRYKREYREATDEEKRFILRAERETLNMLRCETLTQVFLSGKWEIFSRTVQQKLLEYANIVYYYDTYNIVYNKEHIKRSNLTRLTVREKNRISANLNSNMGKLFLDQTTKLHNRAIKKLERLPHEELHASEDYIKHAKTFHDIIIKKDAKDIRKKLKAKT